MVKYLWGFLLLAASLEGRLYFLHAPKTGGTTLRLLLEMQVSAGEIYPARNILRANPPIDHDLVSGHFPYWYCRQMDERFDEAFKVTILRDPVERYLSFLRAKKKADSRCPDLESVLKLRDNHKYPRSLIDNVLCRYLAQEPNLEGKALLESAKQTLRELDCVILFDHFTENILELFQRLGVKLEKEVVLKMNGTQKEPVSLELLNKVKALNKLDIELYDFAKKHLQKKRDQYPLRTESYEALLEKARSIDYSFDLPLNGRGWTYREICQKSIDYPFYRWVMDRPAEIIFQLEEGVDYDLCFWARALTDQIYPRVQVNGKEIEVTQMSDGLFSLYQGRVPRESVTEETVRFTFFATQAFEYRAIHPSTLNRNHPPLSFAINRIRITPSSS